MLALAMFAKRICPLHSVQKNTTQAMGSRKEEIVLVLCIPKRVSAIGTVTWSVMLALAMFAKRICPLHSVQENTGKNMGSRKEGIALVEKTNMKDRAIGIVTWPITQELQRHAIMIKKCAENHYNSHGKS